MMVSKQNNKRLLKNTLFLYGRTLFTMLIALYTSRVVLQVLGASDYGIYGVVASFVSTFTVVRSNLNVASNRFLSFELGKENSNTKKIFSAILTIHALAALAIFVSLEILGCYYVFNWLNVPADRLNAAFWAFQFSAVGFFVIIIAIPYVSSIIANEKMKCFAYVGILEAIMKLIICFLITEANSDKLIVYSALYLLTLVIVTVVEIIYCLKNLPETRVLFKYDKAYFRSFGKFLGWNGLGSLAVMLREQGVSLLYNYFFGPVINAAKSITTQIQQAVSSFSGNFITALNPQITKLCAAKDFKEMDMLVHRGARLSYFLMLFFSLPIIINIDEILRIWLGKVPEYTSSFVQLSLVFFTLKSLQATLTVAILASGQVKKYNLYWGGLNILIFPISLLLFYCGYSPNSSFVVCIIITLFVQFFTFAIYKRIFSVRLHDYFREVISRIALVSILSVIFPLAMRLYMHENFLNAVLNIIVTFFCVAVCVYKVGMTRHEREKIFEYFKKKIIKS